jgi:hypothetical protein
LVLKPDVTVHQGEDTRQREEVRREYPPIALVVSQATSVPMGRVWYSTREVPMLHILNFTQWRHILISQYHVCHLCSSINIWCGIHAWVCGYNILLCRCHLSSRRVVVAAIYPFSVFSLFGVLTPKGETIVIFSFFLFLSRV